MSDLRTFGVTVGLRAQHVQDVVAAGGREALREAFRETGAQATEALKAYVGGAPFRSEPAVSIDGPKDDPLQGPMYAISVAALFDVRDLGVDSPAALLVATNPSEGTSVDVARSVEGEEV